MTDNDDVHERPTMEQPPPVGDPPSLPPSVLESIPVSARTAFDNLALEVRSLSAHVHELVALVLRNERTVQTLVATVQTLEARVKFVSEQVGESLTDASEEVLRSRQAVVELVPRIHEVERRLELVEHRRASNGEDG